MSTLGLVVIGVFLSMAIAFVVEEWIDLQYLKLGIKIINPKKKHFWQVWHPRFIWKS